jgi:class 3 adenylate cyclase/tetratricopeptide (TPR) repeat protein
MAIENYQEGLRMANLLGDIHTVGTFHNNLAIVSERQGRDARSLENYLIALRILGGSADKNVLQMIYNNISQIYSHYKNYDEALSYGLKAEALAKETGNKFMLGHAYMGCAHVYNSTGRLEEALDHYQRALDIKLELGDKNGAAIAYNGIGGIQQVQGKYESALDNHNKALALNIEAEARSAIAETLSNLGGVYLHIDQYDKAEKNLNEALALAYKVGSKRLESQIFSLLYRLRKKQGDAAAALEYYEQHIEAANQVTNADIATQMANLKGTYDLEIKDKEKQAVEKILHNILPVSIAERIKNGEEKIIERFSDVSVLFADMAGFTRWSADKDVHEVASLLDKLFGIFDGLAHTHGVEKIKTIGDAYMCVAGLPEPCEDHAERIAEIALDMRKKVKEEFPEGDIHIRIGIHTGEVIAGIIGRNKYAFDLWGDTVNTASRMESHGVPDRIQVSSEFRDLLHDKYHFEERGEIDIKGKKKHKTYFLLKTY